MEYRRLGNSGLKVSAISLGGWINFEEKIAEEEARRIVNTAYESGINYFDLADVYGYGAAEQWMGAMLLQFPRRTLVVATKVFFPMSDDVNDRGLSRKHIFESLERSLTRLQMDYVDIYFCHRPDPETPLLETARAMDDLIRQGLVHYWGTSEWEPEVVEKVSDLCDEHGLHAPQVEQPEYSLLVRHKVEQRIGPVARERGMGLVVWSPLAMGMLTGKYDDGIPEGSRFDKEEWSKRGYFTEANVGRVRRLKPIADDLGVTRAQLALAWLRHQEGVSSVITGATSVAQLEENVKAAELELSSEALERIEESVAAED